MILYGTSFSPFVRKVLAYAAEKGIAIDLKRIARGSDDPEFREASPLGKMPALRDGDFLLSDSTAIIAYLEALHPTPALIPTEARAWGRTMFWDEYADTELFGAIGPIFLNRVVLPKFERKPGSEAAAERGEASLPRLLAFLEARIPDTLFLVGGGLTLADLAVASPLVNLEYAGGSLAAYPRVAAFRDAMLARDSFAAMVVKEKAFLARFA